MQLRALSPLAETHALLVGQRLHGRPEVAVVDVDGVSVRDLTVRFSVTGDAVMIQGVTGNELDCHTNTRGWAVARGSYGTSAGRAAIAVTIPMSSAATALTYFVNVIAVAADPNGL